MQVLGPEGMGALVVDRSTIDRLTPALAGWLSFERVDSTGEATWWGDGRRFESTGFHRPSVVGMARSIGWLSMFVGLEFVYRRGTTMAAQAATLLAAIPGVSVLTPTTRMATLVTFRIAGWTAHVLEQYAHNRLIRPRTEYIGPPYPQTLRPLGDS